jgi:hypothetical protein
MTFAEVLNDLLSGLPVYRKGWQDGHFIYYEDDWNMFSEARVEFDFHVLCHLAPLRGSDLAADDWQVDEWEDEANHIVVSNKKEVVE